MFEYENYFVFGQECTTVKEIHSGLKIAQINCGKRVRCLDSARTVDIITQAPLEECLFGQSTLKKSVIVLMDSRLTLYRRVEMLGSKVEEYFDGRSDRWYRGFDLLQIRTLQAHTLPSLVNPGSEAGVQNDCEVR